MLNKEEDHLWEMATTASTFLGSIDMGNR